MGLNHLSCLNTTQTLLHSRHSPVVTRLYMPIYKTHITNKEDGRTTTTVSDDRIATFSLKRLDSNMREEGKSNREVEWVSSCVMMSQSWAPCCVYTRTYVRKLRPAWVQPALACIIKEDLCGIASLDWLTGPQLNYLHPKCLERSSAYGCTYVCTLCSGSSSPASLLVEIIQQKTGCQMGDVLIFALLVPTSVTFWILYTHKLPSSVGVPRRTSIRWRWLLRGKPRPNLTKCLRRSGLETSLPDDGTDVGGEWVTSLIEKLYLLWSDLITCQLQSCRAEETHRARAAEDCFPRRLWPFGSSRSWTTGRRNKGPQMVGKSLRAFASFYSN